MRWTAITVFTCACALAAALPAAAQPVPADGAAESARVWHVFDSGGAELPPTGSGTPPSYFYLDKLVAPVAKVTDGSAELAEGRDYLVKYRNNESASDAVDGTGAPVATTATATVSGCDSRRGMQSETFSFEIRKASISDDADVSVSGVSAQPEGTAPRPRLANARTGTVFEEGVDYEVACRFAPAGGEGKVEISALPGPGSRCVGHRTIAYRVLPSSDRDELIPGPVGTQAWTGSTVCPDVAIRFKPKGGGGRMLQAGADYSLSYRDNVSPGTAVFTARGTGAYAGLECSGTFEISPAADAAVDGSVPLSAAAVEVAGATYTGSAIEPRPSASYGGKALAEGADYEVLGYSGNVNAGTATVTLAGIGRFHGKKTATFEIGRADISKANIGRIRRQVANGKALRPGVAVTFNGKRLVEGKSYDVAYRDTESAGRGRAVITGKGNFKGRATRTFAVAAPAYTIVFKANGGKGKMPSARAERGRKAKLPGNRFSRPGYVFQGWNTKKNGKGKAYKDGARVRNLAKAGKKVKLYAQWKHRGQLAAEAALGELRDFKRAKYRRLVYGTDKLNDSSACSEFVTWCLHRGGARAGTSLISADYVERELKLPTRNRKGAPIKWSYAWEHVAYYRDHPEWGRVYKPGSGYDPQPGDVLVSVNDRHSDLTRHLRDAKLSTYNHMVICVGKMRNGETRYLESASDRGDACKAGSCRFEKSKFYCIHLKWEKIG